MVEEDSYCIDVLTRVSAASDITVVTSDLLRLQRRCSKNPARAVVPGIRLTGAKGM